MDTRKKCRDSQILAASLYGFIARNIKDKPQTIEELLVQNKWLADKFPNYTLRGVGKSLCAMIRRYNNKNIAVCADASSQGYAYISIMK